jgi:DNA-binding transcriptional MerR regulator
VVIGLNKQKEDFITWHIKITEHQLPPWDELPNFDLYMDQVINLMERYLGFFAEEGLDKILTPAMVNNYVKSGLIPPPVAKRYGRKHLAYLIMICILKQVLSIAEIKALITSELPDDEFKVVYNDFCIKWQQSFQQVFSFDGKGQLISDNDVELGQMADMALQFAILANTCKAISSKIIDLEKIDQTEETGKQKKAEETAKPKKTEETKQTKK